MILTHKNIETEIEWTHEKHAFEIVIENRTFMRGFVDSLINQVEDGDGVNILSSGKLLNYSKDIDVIFDPTHLDFNNRRAITSLLKEVLKVSMSEDFYLETNEIKGKIAKYLNEIIDSRDFSFELETDEFSMDQLAKTLNLHIVGDSEGFAEYLIDYLEAMTELANIKLFIFVGLRSFIEDEELDRVLKSAKDREINILLIESNLLSKRENCDRKIIDSDLCEI